MKRVTFLRHGSTGSLVSTKDEHITEAAKEELSDFGKMLSRHLNKGTIKLAYGDLVRHKESAEVFMNAYGKNKVWQVETKDLNEKDYGELYNLHDEETRRKIADATWSSEYEARFVESYGCETNKSVYDRLSDVWYDLQTSEPDTDDIVIISSGGALAMLQFIAEGKTLSEIEDMPQYEQAKKVLKHGEMRTMEIKTAPPMAGL